MAELPVAVVLHGRGLDHASAFDPGGGNTYWHPRASGEDAGALVIDEFLPLVADHGLDVRRVGFLGWSMGGYGALSLAGRLGPDRVGAVAAMSPALWHDFDDTAPGAFDDAENFATATVFGREHELDRIPVRIDTAARATPSTPPPGTTSRGSTSHPQAASNPATTTWTTGDGSPLRHCASWPAASRHSRPDTPADPGQPPRQVSARPRPGSSRV